MKPLLLGLFSLLIAGCVATPHGVSPVRGFDLDRYLGTWYEIARLDHRFERGLSQVSAHYSKRTDGGIDVLNRGFNAKTGEWKEVKGRAYPIGEPGTASLKVTFFWPFYAGYHVIELDRDRYSYALVCGPGKDYLWILSRQKTLDQETTDRLISIAGKFGFATDELIFVAQQD